MFILHPLSTVIFPTATVLAFVLLRSSNFSFHCYTQREATPTQKSARKCAATSHDFFRERLQSAFTLANQLRWIAHLPDCKYCTHIISVGSYECNRQSTYLPDCKYCIHITSVGFVYRIHPSSASDLLKGPLRYKWPYCPNLLGHFGGVVVLYIYISKDAITHERIAWAVFFFPLLFGTRCIASLMWDRVTYAQAIRRHRFISSGVLCRDAAIDQRSLGGTFFLFPSPVHAHLRRSPTALSLRRRGHVYQSVGDRAVFRSDPWNHCRFLALSAVSPWKNCCSLRIRLFQFHT